MRLPANDSWTDEKIAGAYRSNIRSIGNIRKRFVEEVLRWQWNGKNGWFLR
jgi:hypothetical protein